MTTANARSVMLLVGDVADTSRVKTLAVTEHGLPDTIGVVHLTAQAVEAAYAAVNDEWLEAISAALTDSTRTVLDDLDAKYLAMINRLLEPSGSALEEVVCTCLTSELYDTPASSPSRKLIAPDNFPDLNWHFVLHPEGGGWLEPLM